MGGCFTGTQHGLPLPPLQVLCFVLGGAQDQAASKLRNKTGADRELKLLAPRTCPTAHHITPTCVLLLRPSSVLHGLSHLGLHPKVLLPLASSDS